MPSHAYRKLDLIFSTHGVPDKIKTDNGLEYALYMQLLGMQLDTSTSLWRPQGISPAKSFMKPFKKLVQTATVGN